MLARPVRRRLRFQARNSLDLYHFARRETKIFFKSTSKDGFILEAETERAFSDRFPKESRHHQAPVSHVHSPLPHLPHSVI